MKFRIVIKCHKSIPSYDHFEPQYRYFCVQNDKSKSCTGIANVDLIGTFEMVVFHVPAILNTYHTNRTIFILEFSYSRSRISNSLYVMNKKLHFCCQVKSSYALRETQNRK